MRKQNTGPIAITGAAGFIGSQVATHVKADNIILIDKLPLFNERPYSLDIRPKSLILDAEIFLEELLNLKDISWIIHLGAITNTAETDLKALKKWNTEYTKTLWNHCAKNKINFIFASSAATYGDGTQGFNDDYQTIEKLKPLNPYGRSKQEFDLWILDQLSKKAPTPPHWYGLKFFNVYGPNENHKGRMASSIWHGYNEIKKSGSMTLFKSHNEKFKDGEQARDFIFIDDILSIIDFLMEKTPANDIYNCGTGQAGTFSQVAEALFETLDLPFKINWIDTPVEFRAAYQYRTEAYMKKLIDAGYSQKFTPLEEGIRKYLSRV
jgi:ADP-L-glycero-D-manno-heptose 6-epimerase